jgi:hypothetical protein
MELEYKISQVAILPFVPGNAASTSAAPLSNSSSTAASQQRRPRRRVRRRRTRSTSNSCNNSLGHYPSFYNWTSSLSSPMPTIDHASPNLLLTSSGFQHQYRIRFFPVSVFVILQLRLRAPCSMFPSHSRHADSKGIICTHLTDVLLYLQSSDCSLACCCSS